MTACLRQERMTGALALFIFLADEPPIPDGRGRLTGYLACVPGLVVGWLASKFVLMVRGTRSISHGSAHPEVIRARGR